MTGVRARSVEGLEGTRLRRAVAGLLVATLVLLVAVALGKVCGGTESTGTLSDVVTTLLSEDVVDGNALEEALSTLDVFQIDEDESLQVFQEEALSLAGKEELRCDLDAGIVGFTAEGDAAEVFSQIEAELEEKGWTVVEGGLASSGTFVKTQGSYGWLYASCVQVGTSTSVVVQVVSFDEEVEEGA